MSLGNFQPGAVIYDSFNTFTPSTGSLGTLANGVLTIDRNGGAASTTTGGSLTMSAGGIVGLNHVAIDTSDGSFYLTAGGNYTVRLSAGSVGTTNAAGMIVTRFSLAKTVTDTRMIAGETITSGAAGTLSIAAKGSIKVGLEASAIGSATFAADGITRIQNGLATPTNITAGTITTATNVTTVNGLAAGVLTSIAFAADGITRIQSGLALSTQVDTIEGLLPGTITTDAGGTLTIGATGATVVNTGTVETGTITGSALGLLALQSTSVAIRAKTDQLTFTVANQVDSNTESINATTIIGTGAAGDKFRV